VHGAGDGDYTYGQVWAERAAPIGAGASTVLRATGGGKAWAVGPQAGLRVDGDHASFAPTAHAGPRHEAFGWIGVDLAARP
jgi:hypothetical protein